MGKRKGEFDPNQPFSFSMANLDGVINAIRKDEQEQKPKPKKRKILGILFSRLKTNA